MNDSREKMGLNTNLMTELRGPFVNFGTHDPSFDDPRIFMTSESLPTDLAARDGRPSATRLPDWCYRAFKLERADDRKQQTDWGFVTPVWIAIALSCTLVQVVAFMALINVV
ncbi:MAG: hypothetical protein AAF996_10730 [Pseudomonadota bacterium]